jgi:hypothetical protein
MPGRVDISKHVCFMERNASTYLLFCGLWITGHSAFCHGRLYMCVLLRDHCICDYSSLRKISKKRIYKTVVHNVMIYGAEMWDVSVKNRKKLLATEMDYI